MYTIRGADQKEYGPVSAEQVHQWIAEHRASGQTLIHAAGTPDWKPLSQFPEFAQALAAAGARPPSGPGAVPAQPWATGSAGQRQNKTLATVSLVLGIMSVSCLWILAGIPAIITGHIAQSRARRSP